MQTLDLSAVYVVTLLIFRGSRIFHIQPPHSYLLIGQDTIGYHVAHIVDEAAHLEAQPVVVVIHAHVIVVALLGLQILIAYGDVLCLVVLIVYLHQSRRAIARAISGTEAEPAETVHQANAGCGIAAEEAVVDVAKSQYALQVLADAHLVLGIEG